MNSDMPVDGESAILSHGHRTKTRPQISPPPSDPNFDRKNYSDSEYIGLLKAEIRDLKDDLNQQNRLIRQLVQSKVRSENAAMNDIEIQMVTSSPSSQDSDIPQRSARRNDELPPQSMARLSRLDFARMPEGVSPKNENRDSMTSITSNGPIDVSGGMLLSPDLKTELNAASLSVPPEEASLEENETKSFLSDLENRQEITETELTFPGRIRSAGGETYLPYHKRKTTSSYDIAPGEQHQSQNVSPTLSTFKSRIKVPVSRAASDTLKMDDESSRRVYSHESVQSSSRLVSNQGAGSQFSSIESFSVNQLRKEEGSEIYRPQNEATNKELNEKSNSDNNTFTSAELGPPFPQSKGDSRGSGQAVDPVFSPHESPKIDVNTRENLGKITGSSFTVLSSMKVEEDDASLFIKPKDFSTVRIKVVSTITVNTRRTDDYNCTFSINDKETSKEMWRFRKSYNQLVSFDSEIRPFIEFFGLPPLPDKSVFSSATPAKVDMRSQALQRYFDNIFLMPHIPQMVLLRICKYISVDFVNPLDDYRSGAKKEGFLIRRYKGLGSTWKVRWCQVDGPELEIYDLPGGSLIEQIKLSGSQIGRQSSDSAAEDRGYRHAFLVLESSKSLKISGFSPKHFFCAESDLERDEWIGAMVEFTDNDPLITDQKSMVSDLYSAQQDVKDSILNISEEVETDTPSRQTYSSSGQSPASAHLNVDDIDCQNLPEDSKQSRKTKMRHLFPFRSKHGQTEDPIAPNLQTGSVLGQQSPEQSMENYLNRLDLSEELSKAIFGRDLNYAYTLSNHDFEGISIPSVCFRCFDFLKKTGAIYEEGIFRLSGSASTIRLLKENFNATFDVDLFESPLKPDIHTVSGLLKTYLRELPHSLFGDTTYHELQRIVTENSKHTLQSQISLMIKDFLRSSGSIDQVAFNFCYVVFGFLRSVVAKSSVNKMSLKNVCIVFVPTLNISVDILHLCLVDFDCIFGDLAPVPDQDREILDLQIPLF